MCIFSQQVEHVGDTRIYARCHGERQWLVYEMHLVSTRDQAMVLPLPTASAREDAVEFIDLSAQPRFFERLDDCCPPAHVGLGAPRAAAAGPLLKVHSVGAFDASFVPSRAQFHRLDPRLRLDDAVWDRLPDYADFGFAVFQLRAGDTRVHPMALSFLSRDPRVLFFPTAHVHDGAVHARAHYDHRLYAQGLGLSPDWSRGSVLPGAVFEREFFQAAGIGDLIAPDAPVAWRRLWGELDNGDVRVVRG